MRDTERSNLSAYLEVLIATRREEASAPARRARPEKIPARLYGIMAVTTVLTFATLMVSYQLLFPPHQLYA